jgi:hypothetical protein
VLAISDDKLNMSLGVATASSKFPKEETAEL